MSEEVIDTANMQLVGVRNGRIVVMAPMREMSKTEALTHAAWLIALADESDEHAEFLRILDSIESL